MFNIVTIRVYVMAILDFFYVAAGLKTTPRQGWIHKLDITDSESVSDHVYMTGMASMVLADLNNQLDVCKVLRMALLHDLAESQIGDYTPEQISDTDKTRLENEAMINILEMLPSTLQNKYKETWEEYQHAKSAESIFVHEVDKLEMALQAKIYSNTYREIPIGKYKPFFETAKRVIQNESLQKILQDIIDVKQQKVKMDKTVSIKQGTSPTSSSLTSLHETDDKDQLINAQNQVIGILFEIVKRQQANADLDTKYFEIMISSTKAESKPAINDLDMQIAQITSQRKENTRVINKLLKKLEM